MKILNAITSITTIACIVISVFNKDWTEAIAWFIVGMYNTKDFVDSLLNDK
jgi:hypothetical protein